MAPTIPNGCYVICSGGIASQSLALLSGKINAPVNIFDGGDLESRMWVVENRPDSNCITLKNVKCNKYIGYPEGKPSRMCTVVASDKAAEFLPEPYEDGFRLFVPWEGERLCLDYSPLRIFPPMAAVMPEPMVRGAWRFKAPN